MLKYKVAFTITGETLFSLLGKILPIEDLAVQEIPDAEGEAIQAQLNQYLKPVQEKIERAKLAQASRPHRRYARRAATIPFNPNGGINKIILDSLINGPRTANAIRPSLTEAGYSPNSVGSRLQKLHHRGIVTKHGDGLWSLTNWSELNNVQSQSRSEP